MRLQAAARRVVFTLGADGTEYRLHILTMGQIAKLGNETIRSRFGSVEPVSG